MGRGEGGGEASGWGGEKEALRQVGEEGRRRGWGK